MGNAGGGIFPRGDFSFIALLLQCAGVVACFLWVFPLAFIIFKLLDKFLGIRASTLHEQRGLDYTEHYEIGYPDPEFQKRLDSNEV